MLSEVLVFRIAVMLQKFRHPGVDLALKIVQDGFVKLRYDLLCCNLYISLIPKMRWIKQFLFYNHGERRTRGFLQEACNLAMIARLTELLAAVTKLISLERLEDPIHIRRYFLKRGFPIYFNPGQRRTPRDFSYPVDNLGVTSFSSLPS